MSKLFIYLTSIYFLVHSIAHPTNDSGQDLEKGSNSENQKLSPRVYLTERNI